VTERLAFFPITVNRAAYLVFQMHQSLPDAATHMSQTGLELPMSSPSLEHF